MRSSAKPLLAAALAAFASIMLPACVHNPKLPDRPKWDPYYYEPPETPLPPPESVVPGPASPDDLALARANGLESIAAELSVPKLRDWAHVVLHHSATESGNAAVFHEMHKKKGWDGLGYHFVIGNGNGSGDGWIEVGWRWKIQREGAHAGNQEYNQRGIGVCFVGNFDEKKTPTPRQIDACVRLLRYLMARCRIPPREIVGHRDVRDTACPGKHFPMAEIVRRAGGGR